MGSDNSVAPGSSSVLPMVDQVECWTMVVLHLLWLALFWGAQKAVRIIARFAVGVGIALAMIGGLRLYADLNREGARELLVASMSGVLVVCCLSLLCAFKPQKQWRALAGTLGVFLVTYGAIGLPWVTYRAYQLGITADRIAVFDWMRVR